MVAGDGAKKGEAGCRRPPIRKKRIKPRFNRAGQERIAGVIMRMTGGRIDIGAE